MFFPFLRILRALMEFLWRQKIKTDPHFPPQETLIWIAIDLALSPAWITSRAQQHYDIWRTKAELPDSPFPANKPLSPLL
jgi:hypothetical protein